MRTVFLVLLIMASDPLNAGDATFRDAKEILARAQQLETTRTREAALPSPAGLSFVKLFTSPQADANVEELAKTAQTPAGKAYTIIGLYELKRDRALAMLGALPQDFRVPVMWYDLKYEWSRDEFERQVKDRRFFEALMRRE